MDAVLLSIVAALGALVIIGSAAWVVVALIVRRWSQAQRRRQELRPRLAIPARQGVDAETPPLVGPGYRVRCVGVRQTSMAAAAAPAKAPEQVVRRHPPIVVKAPVSRDPLWREKGWRPDGNGWCGEFQAGGRRWQGKIEMPYRGYYQTWLANPPLRELEGHEHRPCFQRTGTTPENWYFVHYHTMPKSLDHAITTVEAVLDDALAHNGRRRL
jgi:hypothetical protein